MANEDSAFWDGITIGDSLSTDVWSAPYSSGEHADIYSKLLASNAARGYVIPGYANNLEITANNPVALNVLVKTGALSVRGRIYENTAQQTLTIGTADATNPRLDRIVARVSLSSSVQTIRLAVLAGTAAATPALASLTQNATTYEISLAYVWVAATATTLAATEVHDERVFAANFESLLTSLLQTNLVKNSEFMAFSRLSTVPTTVAGRPDTWDLVGTTTFASATKPAQMSRGRAIQMTAGAATSGMSQTFRALPSTFYSFRVLMNVTAGDVGVFKVTDNGGTPVATTRNVRRTGAYIEETIYITTASDATILTVSVLANSNTDIVTIGQVLAAQGYLPGTYREIREVIFFDHAIGDASWNSTAKSSATTTIDCDTDFQALVLPGTRAGYIHLIGRDSSSATVNCVLGLRSKGGTLSLVVTDSNGAPNNTERDATGYVPIDFNNQFDIVVIATGASTFTASVRFHGISI